LLNPASLAVNKLLILVMSDFIIKNEDFDEKTSINLLENTESNKNDELVYNYSILAILRGRKKKSSIYSSFNFNYKENEINKFDEVNTSLRKISNFDLEKEEDQKEDSLSFNSSDNGDEDSSIEFELITEAKIANYINDDKVQYNLELDKEFEEIEKEILSKKN
jgi:hypothetical protein